MNIISTDGIIRSAKNNLVIQKFNQDYDTKIGLENPKDENTWVSQIKENYLLPGLGNYIETKNDISDYSYDKDRKAPEDIVNLKNKDCVCQTLNSSNNYICSCDKNCEKKEEGKTDSLQESFKTTIDGGNFTISINNQDILKLIIVLLLLIICFLTYNLFIIKLDYSKLKFKYKKMKHNYK